MKVKTIFQSHKFICILIFILIATLPVFYTYALGVLSDDYSLTATIYDSSQYSLGGEGLALTEEGVTISNWQYDTSKFLQINPIVPDDGKTYVIGVKVPQELYIVTKNLTAPTGFQNVSFTKNEDISANGGTATYSVNAHSGTAYYTIAPGVTTSTLQLEIAYDQVLWNLLGNSLITKEGVTPLEVSLSVLKDNGELEKVKTLTVSKAYSGSSYSVFGYLNWNINNVSSTGSASALTEQEIAVDTSLIPTSQQNEYLYFEHFDIEILLPKYKDSSGITHYVDVNWDKLVLYNFKGTASYQLDDSLLNSEGKVILHFEKTYFYTGRLFRLYFCFPESLKNSSEASFVFTGGKNIFTTIDKANTKKTIAQVSWSSITYNTEAIEDVSFYNSNYARSVSLGSNNQAVSQLGGFYLKNDGQGDSEKKEAEITFDTTNTGNIKVTTISLPTDPVQENILITYTLVDDENNLVYLDATGNRVPADTEGAISEWSYSLKNQYYNSKTLNNIFNNFYRELLPENHRQYYFKTIRYSIATIPANSKLYQPSGFNGITTAGNFYGYLKEGLETATTAISQMTISSEHYDNITAKATSSLSPYAQSAYSVQAVRINNRLNSTESITAGNSVNITGDIVAINYPYGNLMWINSIVIALVLPDGLSLNENSILLSTYTTNINNPISPTTTEMKALNNGYNLWKIYVPSDVMIGYANEQLKPIANGNALHFKFQLDTAYYMSQQTVTLNNALYAASIGQTNGANGAYNWASKVDTYDLNENGATNDKIGGMAVTDSSSIEITPQNATFEIDDSISVTSNGDTSEASDKDNLYTKEDEINYQLSLDCLSGGTAKDFVYYIPVPKKNSVIDGYMITSTDKAFDMELQKKVIVSGNDLYNIYYTFETGLNFNNASNENLIWYTSNEIKEQGLNYKNVTMIKLLPKNTIIENGSSTRISISLKYAGTTYEEEAGMQYNWHSAGYYHYSINGRELSGNFSTNGVTATLNYLNELNGFTLTAAKNMSPKIEGNINEYTTTADSLPQFINSHHFQVTNVQTYNVTLQTKEHMLANQDMAGIYANETFGITVSINGEKEVDILSTAGSETPIDVGTSTSNDVTTFHYKLYNANALSDNSKVRYIIVTLTSDNGVVIKQKINIDCEPTEAAAPESAIVAGKRYLTFDDSSSNIAISADSSFTSQFVVRYIPNLYRTKKFTFSEALPIGTMITILNKVEQDTPSYWYYKVENNLTKEIEFSNFIRMGTTDTKDYTYLTGANEIEEIFLVLVDFSQCTEVMAEGTYSLSLMFDAISTDNFSSKQLQFEIKNKRTFSLTASSSEMIFGQDVEINYLTEKTAGVESKYMSRKLALVISAPDNIPLDTHLVYNKTKYYLNSNRQFILPLGDVQSEGGSIKFSIFSELLPKISNNYLFNISLYVSATSNAEAPLFGEKVSETTITFKNQKQPQPAFKVEKSTFRTISKEKLNEIHTIDFQYLPDEDCNVFVELQQKIGSGYQKVTDKLTQVNGSTSHTMGVYSVSTMEGSNKIPFKLAPTTETGTYRLLFTIKNSNEQVISVIPYNFVIIT